ncbi:MAG: hypothetical protein FJ118_20475 [Deltaproteobacteria bacterium]|nr:hypothetical protein [Deltaproteobacteria bacterium]
MAHPLSIETLFEDLKPRDVVFWTGAGISVAPPTKLPDGYTLTVESMKIFMPWSVVDSVYNTFQKKIFKDAFGHAKAAPRLELVIQNAHSVLGHKAFECFSFMDIPYESLNKYHYFFASHVLLGGTHFTMNLDNGIERAMELLLSGGCPIENYVVDDPDTFNDPDAQFAGKLIKLHGSMAKRSTQPKLGLILNNITAGLGRKLSNKIREVLQHSRLLCFVGYGSVDSFDVTRFFDRQLGSDLRLDLVVLWVQYGSQKTLEEMDVDKIKNGGPTIIAGCQRNGCQSYGARGNAESGLIEPLSSVWNITIPAVETKNYDWRTIMERDAVSVGISDELRILIGGRFAWSLGMGKLAVKLAQSTRPENHVTPPPFGEGVTLLHEDQYYFFYTNGLRDLGRHGQAISQLRKWFRSAARTHFNEFFYHYRLMGEYRLRGNFCWAILHYLWGKRHLDVRSETFEGEQQQFVSRFYVDYLHVYKDLFKTRWFRCGLSRVFLSLARKEITKAWLAACRWNCRTNCDPHVFAVLAHLARYGQLPLKYVEVVETASKEIVEFDKSLLWHGPEVYVETDSFIGDINFHWGQIDQRLNKGLYDEETRSTVQETLRKAIRLFDRPGVWKGYAKLAALAHAAGGKPGEASKTAIRALRALAMVDYGIVRKIGLARQLKRLARLRP